MAQYRQIILDYLESYQPEQYEELRSRRMLLSTVIELSLPVASDYSLTIYNVTGQVVETFSGSGEAGYQTIEWDASDNASGVYFYKLTTGKFTDTKKMVLLK